MGPISPGSPGRPLPPGSPGSPFDPDKNTNERKLWALLTMNTKDQNTFWIVRGMRKCCFDAVLLSIVD